MKTRLLTIVLFAVSALLIASGFASAQNREAGKIPPPPVAPGHKIANNGLSYGGVSTRQAIADCYGSADNPHYARGRTSPRWAIGAKGKIWCPSGKKPKVQSWTYIYRYRWYGQEQLASAYSQWQRRNTTLSSAYYKCRKSTHDWATKYTYRNWSYGKVLGWNGKTYTGGAQRSSRGYCRSGGLNFN